jgi:hypothetical protein
MIAAKTFTDAPGKKEALPREAGVPDPPPLPHCTRQQVLRGGNRYKLWWWCRDCEMRLIECPANSPETPTYFPVAPCSLGSKSIAELVPGTMTDLTGKVVAATPPYPFPDRRLFSQEILGRERVKPKSQPKPKAKSKAASSSSTLELDKRIADLEAQLEKATRLQTPESTLADLEAWQIVKE